MSKICFTCGNELPDEAKFCDVCGTEMNEKTSAFKDLPPEPPKPVFCFQCGHKLDSDANFCDICGAATEKQLKRQQEQEMNTSKMQPNEQKSNIAGTEKYQQGINYPNTSQQGFMRKGRTSAKTFADFDAEKEKVAYLIGANSLYYQRCFEELRHGGNHRINWASFFGSIYHAAYRNMWREYIQFCYIPFLITHISGLIGAIAVSSFSLGLLSLASIAAIGGMIASFIRNIQFSKRFNCMYMNHIDDMMSGKLPYQAGTNTAAVWAAIGIMIGLTIVENFLGFSATLSAIGGFY